MEKNKAKEYSFGIVVVDTKDNGRMVERKGMASCVMQMETSSKVNGQMTKLMEMELILMQMEQNMQGNGEMINSTAKVWKHGLTGQSMKACISKAKRMGMEN